TGDTNNLFALMDHVFGPRLGTLINQNLDGLRGKLAQVRSSIADFFRGVNEGMPSLSTFGNALKGVFEQLLTGGMSGAGANGLARLGDAFGIDDLEGKTARFITHLNSGIQTATGYAIAFGRVFTASLGRIGDNISQIFSNMNWMGALDTALNFIGGVL